jgi:hypothetical protein
LFIHLESRRVDIAGITVEPDEPWMKQIARNVTMEECGVLRDCSYLLHDRDTKYTQSFRAIIASGRVEPLALPARSPNLNAFAERWVRSVKEERSSKVVLFGERSLRRALSEYVEHFHAERNHQGKGNVLLFPGDTHVRREAPVQCRERLGGLLRLYEAPRVKGGCFAEFCKFFYVTDCPRERRSAFMATVARVLGRASGQPPKPGGARRRREGLTAKARAERQWVLPCFVAGSDQLCGLLLSCGERSSELRFYLIQGWSP